MPRKPVEGYSIRPRAILLAQDVTVSWRRANIQQHASSLWKRRYGNRSLSSPSCLHLSELPSRYETETGQRSRHHGLCVRSLGPAHKMRPDRLPCDYRYIGPACLIRLLACLGQPAVLRTWRSPRGGHALRFNEFDIAAQGAQSVRARHGSPEPYPARVAPHHTLDLDQNCSRNFQVPDLHIANR